MLTLASAPSKDSETLRKIKDNALRWPIKLVYHI